MAPFGGKSGETHWPAVLIGFCQNAQISGCFPSLSGLPTIQTCIINCFEHSWISSRRHILPQRAGQRDKPDCQGLWFQHAIVAHLRHANTLYMSSYAQNNICDTHIRIAINCIASNSPYKGFIHVRISGPTFTRDCRCIYVDYTIHIASLTCTISFKVRYTCI